VSGAELIKTQRSQAIDLGFGPEKRQVHGAAPASKSAVICPDNRQIFATPQPRDEPLTCLVSCIQLSDDNLWDRSSDIG
jgi:hypothetical protein